MKRLKALRELRKELGAEVFLVGGTVRDLVRRREPNDLDLVVRNIAPPDFEAFLRERGDLRLVGKSFGVYLFRPKRSKDFIEIAFPRTEVSTGDGHREFVVHSDPALSIEEDSRRRDFTLNAMYLSIDSIDEDGKFDRQAVIDFHNGLEHIHRRLVVAVGNPEDRIHEDPLRMMRAMVLVARTGYRLEGNTFGAIKRYSQLTDTVAPERIRDELIKIMKTDKPSRAFKTMARTGLLWKLPVTLEGQDVFEWVPRFTLIGATTLPGKLSKPFLDRFKIQSEFETYSMDEAIKIVGLHAKAQDLTLGSGVPEAIARRSRGVPRLVVRFLDRLSDAALVAGRNNPTYKKVITKQLAEAVFRDFLRVDDRGLTKTDIKILKQLSQLSDPVGVDTLATIANEDRKSVENTIEPYLIQEGLLIRTKRGRLLTEEGRRYLETAGYIETGPALPRTGRLIGAAVNEQ